MQENSIESSPLPTQTHPMRHPKFVRALAALGALCLPALASAQVTLVKTTDAGYYNNQIGNTLNLSGLSGTTGSGADNCAEPFPIANDCNATYSTAPKLDAASSILGNWLTDPLNLNSNWSFLGSIPNSWAIDTEVAVMYQFNTLGATNVVAKFGVDNGMYAWLNGQYIFGKRDQGGVGLYEYTLNLGDLAAGTHFLQLILEDHGWTNGYAVDISADDFIPGPPPNPTVPEPSTSALMAIGLVGVVAVRRRLR
ncbi:PEP-CTERM sorting domain-containing protein [Gemmatimonas sp.]|uniref:PEP-CTERM sorting domain-containing protein n=1 Tax=Gemmatimonas sp. TaxID=1962908 RepID=UPI003DA2027A